MPTNSRLALIHRSYCNEHPEEQSNERLEFLGDSVLSLIISERLYKLLPLEPEGILTARRSYLVQTSTLAEKAKTIGLPAKILLSRGEEDSGGRNNPSILADTFEATLGGLYLDEGFDACQKFLSEVFPDSELVAKLELKDPKSLLQERAQAANLGTPTYRILAATGPDHNKIFRVAVIIDNKNVSEGEGSSKQRAETAAAALALAKFPSD